MTEPSPKKPKMSALSQLKNFTVVVADTGDFESTYNMTLGSCSVLAGASETGSPSYNIARCTRARFFSGGGGGSGARRFRRSNRYSSPVVPAVNRDKGSLGVSPATG